MTRVFFFFFLVCLGLLPAICLAQQANHRQGTIVRMRMGECLGVQRGLMASLSGEAGVQSGELCPEYVLVTDKVVYTIIGKSSSDLLPLAEETRFRFQKNQLLIRIDDAKRESKFEIKEMMLRAEWEQVRLRQAQHADDAPWHPLDSAATARDQ